MHQDACQSHQKAHFVASIWKRTNQTDPTGEVSPTDYEWRNGWKETENSLEPDWYPTSALLDSLTATPMNDGDSMGVTSTDDEESNNAWSVDSDNTDEEDV